MKNIVASIRAEYIKIRKSKVLYITLLVFTIFPLMISLLMFLASNPDIAEKAGIMGEKAKMFGKNDWAGYFELLLQTMSAIGLIGSGFVTSWVFGREHIDRTIKDLLALPATRSSIVFAKFVISTVWCMLLFLLIYVIGILTGWLIGIPGWSSVLFADFSRLFLGAAFLTLLLITPVAFLAGYSRGIIAPIGFVILTLILANFTGILGLGPYFPWAILGLFAVAKEADGMHLMPASYVILLLTFIAGYWATISWWRKADHY